MNLVCKIAKASKASFFVKPIPWDVKIPSLFHFIFGIDRITSESLSDPRKKMVLLSGALKGIVGFFLK